MTISDNRVVVNQNFLFTNDYIFINHVYQGDVMVSPRTNSWATQIKTWMQCLDTNGWPNDPLARTLTFGGGLRLPNEAQFAGPYILDWQGDGEVFLAAGTWTVNSSSGVTVVGNGHYKNSASGTSASINITLASSGVSGPFLFGVSFLSDIFSNNLWMTNVRFYRAADAADLAAGLVFRRPVLQSYVDLLPSAIRFMVWTAKSDSRQYRFENRPLPGAAGNANHVTAPRYGHVTGTNIYSLAAVTGTPASMTHGEVACCVVDNAPVRQGSTTISSITNANPGHVTTSAAHGFNVGDQIIHQMPLGDMPNLNYFPCQVRSTNFSATGYDLCPIGNDAGTINTTAFGAFSSGFVGEYMTLNVGARGDFPILFTDAQQYPSTYPGQIPATGEKTFYYDKNVAGITDGSGNWVSGAWLMQADQGGSDFINGTVVPTEYCTEFVNEVNALALSQGIRCPINMYITLPVMGINATDPDYTSGSDFAVNTVTTILNGANGYAGLTANANLFIEFGNETWNIGSGGVSNSSYLPKFGVTRWGNAAGIANVVDMYVLRSTLAMRSIKAAFPSNSRIIAVLAGQSTFTSRNNDRANANASGGPGTGGFYYATDASNTWGTIPMAQHDCFTIATYFDPSASYCTGQFITDSANYATGVPAAQATAISNFVANVQSNGDFSSIADFINTWVPGTQAVISGKPLICYEGGTDWATVIGGNLGGHTITADDNTFILAMMNSSQWAAAQIGFFNSYRALGAFMPSILDLIVSNGDNGNMRFALTTPDAYGGSGTVENQGLLNSNVYVAMSAYDLASCLAGIGGTGGGSQSHGNKYGIFKSRPTRIPQT